MSDTPRTDAFVKAYWASEEDNRPRWSDFARGLELEVSLLRKRILDDNKAYGCELRDPSGTIWDHAKQLQEENAELRERLDSVQKSHFTLSKDNAALRADKERLDFLGQTKCAYYYEGPCCWRINEDKNTDGDTLRAAIDAARKEAQP